MTYRYTKLDDGEGLDGGPRFEIDGVHGFTVCIVDEEYEARLFCAAPDLLEALQTYVEDTEGRFGEIPDDMTAYHNARRVIAKAKGS